MKIFIDESGCFNVKTEEVSVLVTLMHPESIDYKIEKFLKKFYKTLKKEEKDQQGEVKGHALSDDSVKKVFEFLSKNKDIKITFDVFEAQIHSPEMIDEFRKGQAVKFQESLDRYMKGPVKSEIMKNELLLIKNWTESKKKISDQDYLMIILLVHQLEVTLQKAIVYYANAKYASAFKDFDFILDNKTSKKMLNYMNDTIPAFLDSRSSGKGMAEIEGTVYKGHPLEKYICKMNGENGFDIGKIFSNKIKYGDSKQHYGLQLADMVVSNIRAIILGKKDKNLFNLIRYNCAYFKNYWLPFKLFILNTKQQLPPQVLARSDIYKFLQKTPSKNWSRVLKPGFQN